MNQNASFHLYSTSLFRLFSHGFIWLYFNCSFSWSGPAWPACLVHTLPELLFLEDSVLPFQASNDGGLSWLHLKLELTCVCSWLASLATTPIYPWYNTALDCPSNTLPGPAQPSPLNLVPHKSCHGSQQSSVKQVLQVGLRQWQPYTMDSLGIKTLF